MNKVKRVLAVGLAAVLTGVTVGTMTGTTALASSVGDVNGDGAIDLADVVMLNKFVAGKGILSDYTAADTNANYVIDGVDSEILSAFLIRTITTLPYTG